jgi:hypothetical protein
VGRCHPTLQFGPQSLKALTRMCNVASAHSVHVKDKGSQNSRGAEYFSVPYTIITNERRLDMMRDKKNVVSISYGLNLTVPETVSHHAVQHKNVIMPPSRMAPFQKR